MKFLAIFALLLTASLVSAFKLRGLRNNTLQAQLFRPVIQEKEASDYSRITYGQYAAPNQFPYQVGLRTRYRESNGLTCGGSLISNEWVLTAAHCLKDAIRVDVYIGYILLFPVQPRHPTQIVFQVQRPNMIEHAGYNRITFQSDIGLVRIPAVRFSYAIKAVRLPPPRVGDFPSYIGFAADLAGWGTTADWAIGNSPTLRYSTFTVIWNFLCRPFFIGVKIYEGKICTATSNRISGCKGDSGSPLVLHGNNIQIGILSFGSALGCEVGYPNAFTRVDFYLGWIHLHTRL